MFSKLLDKVLDKAQTADFWRGLLYVAAGAGVVVEPALANQIVAGALLASGVVHTIWHKTQGKPDAK